MNKFEAIVNFFIKLLTLLIIVIIVPSLLFLSCQRKPKHVSPQKEYKQQLMSEIYQTDCTCD